MAVPHDLPLVSTVAVGMSLAFVLGLIAVKLRVPPIVGYLLAGVIMGPHTPGFVADLSLAEQLSEIGIVLLMFGVGLHFSLKDLMEVRRIALPGAVVQIAVAMAMGAGLTYIWGWSLASGLMFGLALSVASTVVLLRSLEEHNLLQTNDGRIAIGWLIVEDLAMVLALVLIPALAVNFGTSAVGHEGAVVAPLWQTLGTALAKLAVFVVVMLVVGKRLLPWLLTMVARTRSRELFTLAVFGMALGVAYGAAKMFGVSFALGAFFAGMMIRESDLNHEVADRALPFQDAFAVLFFIAVGMLFDPSILWENPFHVVLVVAIIMVGKSLAALSIVLLFGYPLKTGLLVSAGLAQIGEFSFILVTLGMAYGLLPEEGRNLILAGAMISIALNPLTFFFSRQIYEYVGRRPRLSNMFNVVDNDLACLRADEKQSLRDLVIMVGYGRVGRHVAENIQNAHIDLVIIDQNRERVEALRENGFHAIAGDASYPEVLQQASIDRAVAVVITVPDPFEARRILETARDLKADIQVLVRAHNDEELSYFMEQQVNLALTGPREIGRRMVEYLRLMRSEQADL
ncbi:MAG: Kef family K(+) transporter [Alphaproteobacteria bacterium]|nr:Kef family K(+) transporter [Alphaproteobacteria bacterium]